MKLIDTGFEGLFKICNFNSADNRGIFEKLFSYNTFHKISKFEIKESYYSRNKKDSLRGMHLQMPPSDHEKLISVINGSILDVVIDLRKKSNTYLKTYSCILSYSDFQSLLIPKGFAHGFLSLEDNSEVLYNVSSVYDPKRDLSIKYDSINFDWKVNYPVLSERDLNGIKLKDFLNQNPF